MNLNPRNITFIVATLVLAIPTISLAQYAPLVGIPGVDASADFNTYINALYALSISVAALLAVIKIVIAGAKYMLSDVVTSKSEAISDIQGSVFGLIIVISAVLILTVINPNLTKTNIFIDTVSPTGNTPSGPNSGTVQSGIGEGGYSYANAGTVANFEADCAAAGDTYRFQSPYDVCYDAIPPATIAELDTLFNVSGTPPNLSYPNNDRAAILKSFQQVILPRRLDPIPGFIATQTGASEVLLAATVIQPDGDFIDRAQENTFQSICLALGRATNKSVKYKSLIADEFNSYELACIVD
jgi:hypothetical protein